MLALATTVLGCARAAAPSVTPVASAASCTFANPLAPGADPWVVRRDRVYYYVKSHDRRIWISRATKLSEVFTAPARAVWSAPDTGWNRTNVWAPELHFIDGRWYIYYAAGRSGPPFTSQHAGVLQSASDDALGPWLDRGPIYTGDSVGTGTGDRWSIDMTVGRIAGRDYAVWSGWAQRASTDKTPQQLYIAPLENPWTISTNRVLLSAPDAEWERGLSTSIRCGVRATTADTTAILVGLGDEPRVDPNVSRAIVRAWRESGRPIVVARYNGEIGHPVLFDVTVFAELSSLEGDRGARGVIQRSADRVAYVDMTTAPPLDVDEPNDLRRLADGIWYPRRENAP